MFIKRTNYIGAFSPKYIEENFCRHGETVLYTRFGNEHIAILMNDVLDGDSLPAPFITRDIEKKNPLWKQSMDMQMGRIPKQSNIERVTKQVRWLTENELHGNMRFEVYYCMYL